MRNLFYFVAYFLSTLTIILPLNVHAFKFTKEICQEYGLGKNWYCEEKEPDFDILEITGQDILNSELSPGEKAIALNELWDVQRKRAVITANKKEIEQFLATHYLIAEKGIGFAKNVQNLIETNPKLVSAESYYKNIADAEEKLETRNKILQENGKKYSLIFIYDSRCKYCARQLPILLKFKSLYPFKIMGISSDSIYFDGLDENITDTSIGNDPLVRGFPSILLLDMKNPRKIFVAKGLITLDELEEKIASRIKENEDEKKN